MAQRPDGAEATGDSGSAGVQAAADAALLLIRSGMRLGLGSGRASAAFIAKLGERARNGLEVSGVPTSRAAAALAAAAGIPLITLDQGITLDLTVDGADEVSPDLDLIKGWGGALVRERIVAAASAAQVILVGPEKLVHQLGERGRIPVEVIPLAQWPVIASLVSLGLTPQLRCDDGGSAVISDNGNVTIDCAPRTALVSHEDALQVERSILALPGVVDTGLFLKTASLVIVGHSDGRVEMLHAPT